MKKVMNLKFGWALLATVLAILVVGCGGGGGTSASAGGTTGLPPGTRVYAVGQFLEFIGQAGNGSIIDPMNMPVGTVARVVFANYDAAGTRTVLAASGFTLAQSYPGASLDASGVLRISANPNNILDISATAVVAGTSKTISAQVWVAALPGTTLVTGKIVSASGSNPLDYIQVDIYDKNKNRVGGGLTMGGGIFSAKVDSTATFMTIRGTTVPVGYFKQMNWKTRSYALTGIACPARLASVPANQTTDMGVITLPAEKDGPPPPPDGCSLG